MQTFSLYRRRIIPNECILLKDDIFLKQDDSVIITKWNSLKPKKDLHHGFSCYFLNEGFKVSKFLRADNSLLYWYCDIVDYTFSDDHSSLLVTDLLADVIIYPDGFIKVVDLDELSDALDQKLISTDMLQKSLIRLNSLLQIIYEGNFKSLQSYIELFE